MEVTEQYNLLMTQMNLFYCDATKDLGKLKSVSLENGQVTQHLRFVITDAPDPGRDLPS